jgi:hydroxyacylglutathione hydrolase
MHIPITITSITLLATGIFASLKYTAHREEQMQAAATQTIDFTSSLPASGTFPEKWIHGSESALDNQDPLVQVHAYNDHTFILRESKAVNYEGAFMYLYFGNDKVILFDQGSTANPEWLPLRKVVDEIIDDWLKKHGKKDIHLILAHTHLHGDHIAAYNQFVDRPNTTLVGLTAEEQFAFFGFKDYPNDVVEFDLGGRVLTFLGAPGHHPAEFNIYDPYTQLMLTGDMFYRGRLYIYDWELWTASIFRLIEFAEKNPITHFVNCHIEMTSTPRLHYRLGTTYQPDEPPMEMTMEQLYAVRDAIAQVKGVPGAHVFDDFILMNMVPWASDPY